MQLTTDEMTISTLSGKVSGKLIFVLTLIQQFYFLFEI